MNDATSSKHARSPIARVTTPSLFTTLQDMGRPGWRHMAVPLSGAADQRSLGLTNICLGNPINAGALECTLNGPTLKFLRPATFAIGGADMNACLNGTPINLYTPHIANEGDELSMGHAQSGARSYIGVRGGLEGNVFKKSVSTYEPANIGGIDGRALKPGDELLAREMQNGTAQSIPAQLLAAIGKETIIRFLPGPELLRAREEGGANQIDGFLGQRFGVAPQSNRMGVRLSANREDNFVVPSIASSAVFPGTIQLPPNNQPIILLSDAQTTGGYPRMGQVIAPDLHLCAQLAPNSKLWLREVTINEAQDIAHIQHAMMHAMLDVDDPSFY